MRRKLEAPNLESLKLFFPNHIPTLTLTSLKYRFPNPDPDEKRKRFWKSLQKIFLSVELCAQKLLLSRKSYLQWVCEGGSKLWPTTRRNSGIIESTYEAPSTITPTLTITLLKYPYPNLNLTLIPKTKALCKLGQFFRLSRTLIG